MLGVGCIIDTVQEGGTSLLWQYDTQYVCSVLGGVHIVQSRKWEASERPMIGRKHREQAAPKQRNATENCFSSPALQREFLFAFWLCLQEFFLYILLFSSCS